MTTSVSGDLFAQDLARHCEHIELPGGRIAFIPGFFSTPQADALFTRLQHDIDWLQQDIVMYGRRHKVPRLSRWYGDVGLSYTYSGITERSPGWLPVLHELRDQLHAALPDYIEPDYIEPDYVDASATTSFNSVLANLYRDGNDSVAWHADDEPELGRNPTIASLSFGAVRRFQLKHRHDKSQRFSLELAHGSLLLMYGELQRHWLHQLPKSASVNAPRINLTFRHVDGALP